MEKLNQLYKDIKEEINRLRSLYGEARNRDQACIYSGKLTMAIEVEERIKYLLDIKE